MMHTYLDPTAVRLLCLIVALILGGLSAIPLQAQEIITSIVAIQSQSSTEDDSALVGERVTIEGIATGIYGDLFFVQEPAGGPWSGIAVYAPDHAVTVGDAVRVTGRVTEYYDLTEIENATIEIVSQDNPLPPPQPLSAQEAKSEAWEGVLVQVTNVTVLAEPDQYGEWRASDASGVITVDDKGIYHAATAGESIATLTAIVDHAFGTYRLIPRTRADIGGISGSGETLPSERTPIYEIQGNQSTTTLAGARINTVGVVTAVGPSGFFLQDAQGDGDPLTSDGIYVYTDRRPDVSSGQCVLVRQDLVSEYYGKTELSRVQTVQPVDGCPTGPVDPVDVPSLLLNTDPAAVLEPLEGMVVALNEFTGVVQGPTKRFRNGDVEIGVIAEKFVPYLPGGRIFQTEPDDASVLLFLSNLLGADLPEAAWGDHIVVQPATEDDSVLAVLDYNFGKYQLALFPGQTVTVTARNAVQDRVAGADADEFTLCTFNAQGMGRGSEQYPTEAEYEQQLQQRARAIAEGLNGCTIIGIQETGTPADAENLAAILAAEHDLDYAAVALEGPNSTSLEFPLTNSLLARTARAEILNAESVQGCSQHDYEVHDTPGTCPRGQYALFNRPPLVVDLRVTGDWEGPYSLTVVVNHWKSKGGDESINVVRRTLQADHVAALVQERLDADPEAHIVVLGDLNDFHQSGPVEALQTGTDPDLIHPYDLLPPLDRYTYIFNGASQVLDHILISPGMYPEFAGIDPLHINADFPVPVELDPVSIHHAGDHDPVQLSVRPAGAGWIGGNVVVPGMLISLRNEAGTGVGVAISDALGDFRFWGLPPGRYRVDFKAPAGITIQAPETLLQVRPRAGLFLQPPVNHRTATLGTSAVLLGAGLGKTTEIVEMDR